VVHTENNVGNKRIYCLNSNFSGPPCTNTSDKYIEGPAIFTKLRNLSAFKQTTKENKTSKIRKQGGES